MKKSIYFIIILSISIFFCFFCSSRRDEKKAKSIDFKSISIIKRDAKEFFEIGHIEKVIKLEPIEDSVIGNIDKLIINKNSEIFIGDYFSSKKVLRFTSSGKFINCYGRIGQGPGEYIQIMGFTIDSDDNIIILTPYKLIKFKINGEFVKEIRINYSGIDITSLNDKIYIYISRYRFSSKIKKSIAILDLEFRDIGGLFEYDTRLEKYLFIALNTFANNKKNLFFIDLYDLKLNQFNPSEYNLLQLIIPNENDKLKNIWEKNQLKEEDRTAIKNVLHRFESIFNAEDTLFLNERCKSRKIFNYWLLNLEKRKAIIFSYHWDELAIGKLLAMRIIGSYDKGYIFSISDPEELNRHKKDNPVLKDIEMSMQDNPLLIFLEIDKNIWD